MQSRRDFGNALVIALVSIALIVGALSISLVEFAPPAAATSTSILIPSPLPLTATSTFEPATNTPTVSIGLPIPTTMTPTSSPPANCPVPSGWGQITVLAGDSLESIAALYRIPADDLRRANCLFASSLVTGSKLYVPPVAANTSAACAPGAVGWTKNYTVKAGDNLYRIAFNHYSTLELIRKVNCRTSDAIYPGEVLWVPNIASTRTSEPTSLPGDTVTPYPTDPLTETALPFTATFVPTSTPSLTPVP